MTALFNIVFLLTASYLPTRRATDEILKEALDQCVFALFGLQNHGNKNIGKF